MAMKTPSAACSVTLPVLTFFSRTPVTELRLGGADDLVDGAVPDDLDLRVLEQALLQDLLGAEVIAAVDHGDALGEVGQEDRLLDGGVAAADDDHFLALVEEAVAGGAGGDAIALERLLRARCRASGPGRRCR